MSTGDKLPYSRRAVVGGGVGLAAVAASPAFAQNSNSASRNMSSNMPPGSVKAVLQNPVDKYPHPPFSKLAGASDADGPRPDCGETSYRGAGRLAGRKALTRRPRRRR
jgi:hypothetical protein